MGIEEEKSMIDVLPSHQLESGLVTQSEMDLARRWTEAITPDSDGDWLDQWLGASLPFSFRFDGKESDSILSQWETQDEDNQKKFIWTDEATGLRIIWHLKRLPDYPAVEWMLEFENTGMSDTPVIEDIQALRLHLNHSSGSRPYTVHSATGGRSFPDDMVPLAWKIPSADGAAVTLGASHPSSNRHMPFFNIETPENRGVLVGIGWSGNWSAQVKVEGSELKARAGLRESHFKLHPGEKIRTPRILALLWEGQRLHGHNMLRQVLHKHYVPRLEDESQKPLVSVNVCFTHHGHGGFLHQATEEPVLSLVEPFAKIGAEVFIIDAGWYDGEPWPDWTGNWRYSRKKYPRGFHPIADPLAEAGMYFGIWFASEHVSKTAPILQEHPEWIRNGTLRMELPEVREWFLDQVYDLIENEGMTCYRQDGAGGYGDDPADRRGITESHHIAGLYKSWDTLLEHHPNLVMEGCSGGGRRIDLETLSRFHWHQKSDRWYETESDQCSLYGANLYLPGGLINIPTVGTDDYVSWSSFAGQFCLAWHPLDEDFPMEQAIRQVERYKRIRHFLSGDFYPLTPCSLEEPWLGYQFHRVDLDAGFALLFKRPRSRDMDYPVSDTFKPCFRGLAPERRYRVHFERSDQDEILTGSELAKGVAIIIGEEKGAEMVEYQLAE